MMRLFEDISWTCKHFSKIGLRSRWRNWQSIAANGSPGARTALALLRRREIPMLLTIWFEQPARTQKIVAFRAFPIPTASSEAWTFRDFCLHAIADQGPCIVAWRRHAALPPHRSRPRFWPVGFSAFRWLPGLRRGRYHLPFLSRSQTWDRFDRGRQWGGPSSRRDHRPLSVCYGNFARERRR